LKNKVVINTTYGGFSITDEMKEYMKKRGLTEEEIDWGIERHNPILIEAVENCKNTGSLAVAEFEGCKYYIDEYDGFEGVMTPNNIPWIIVNSEECKEKYPEEFI